MSFWLIDLMGKLVTESKQLFQLDVSELRNNKLQRQLEDFYEQYNLLQNRGNVLYYLLESILNSTVDNPYSKEIIRALKEFKEK